MRKFKKTFLVMVACLMSLSLFSGSVSAETPEIASISNETLTKEDIQARAIVVDLPGQLKYHGVIPNHLLPELIASRDKKTTILNWIAWGMGAFWSAPAAGAGMAASAAGILAGSPTAKYQEAYNKGQSVYYGAYYSTPQPGLTSVPFIYYSSTPLIYQTP